MTVFPNPAKDQAYLKMQVESADYLNCYIYSVQGKMVSAPRLREYLGNGEHTIELDIARLILGTYIVQVTLGRSLNAKTLVIQ